MAFDINLEHDTLISVLVDRDSWNHGPLSVSGIHMAVQVMGSMNSDEGQQLVHSWLKKAHETLEEARALHR